MYSACVLRTRCVLGLRTAYPVYVLGLRSAYSVCVLSLADLTDHDPAVTSRAVTDITTTTCAIPEFLSRFGIQKRINTLKAAGE
jgi:hypothetical protein